MALRVVDTAVLLCAGVGSRLGSRTSDCPKVMVPVGGKPLLQHHLEWLRDAGFRRVFINLHHHPDKITAFVGDGRRFDLEVTCSYEPSLRGTGGALNGFREILPDDFLIHYGDIYSELDLHEFRRVHLRTGGTGTLVVQPTQRPHDSDIVEVQDGGRITAVHHKPGDFRFGNLGNAACKILNRRILDFLPDDGQPYDLVSDVIARALAAGEQFFAYTTAAPMFDIGTTDRLTQAEEYVNCARR
jgi:mannose-1-phosphate guanylyltransferase